MILEAISTVVRSFERRSIAPLDVRIWQEAGYTSQSSSGIPINADSAMRVSTVYSCVKILSDTIAQLPLQVMRRNADGTNTDANDTPIAQVLRRPNEWQTSFEWRQMMMAHLVLRGNAYSEIVPGPLGAISSLIPLHPDRMKIERLENGRLRYEYYDKMGRRTVYLQDEILHLRGISTDGITGLSTIQLHRDSIGLSQAHELYGASLFKNSARPAAILTHPGRLTEQAATKLRERWDRMHAGADNAGRTAVLEEGMDAKTLGMTQKDAEFIESRNYQSIEVANIFRIPAHMINNLSRATLNNIEQMSIDFVRFTMGSWLSLWEQSIYRDCITEDDLYVKFNVNGLLRGDSTARANFYKTMRDGGVFSANDIRRLEDLDPIDGGDIYLVPMNMVPMDMARDIAQSQIDAKTQPAPAPAGGGEMAARLEFWHNEAQKQNLRNAELESKSDSRIAPAIEHCRKMLCDTARSQIHFEVEAIRAAAKKPNFIVAMDKFYDDHRSRYSAKMQRLCDLYRVLTGDDIPYCKRVDDHIAESKAQLLDVAGKCRVAQLGEEVSKVVDGWMSRADKWMEMSHAN